VKATDSHNLYIDTEPSETNTRRIQNQTRRGSCYLIHLYIIKTYRIYIVLLSH